MTFFSPVVRRVSYHILIVIALFGMPAWGQTHVAIQSYTVAQIPNPASKAPNNTLIYIIDAASSASCTVGGGTTLVMCTNGPSASAWVPFASGGSPAGSTGNVQINGGGGSFGVATGWTFSGTLLSGTQTGVFTNTVQNETTVITLNAGGACTLGVSGDNGTDGLGVCVSSPSGATAGLINGVGSYVFNRSGVSNQAANAYLGYATCLSGGGECEGMTVATTDAGNASVQVGYEADNAPMNSGSRGYSFLAEYQTFVQSTNFVAYGIQSFTSAAGYTAGFDCQDATILTNTAQSNPCLRVGKQVNSGSTNSFSNYFIANDGSSDFGALFELAGLGHYFEVSAPLVQLNPTGIEAYGAELTSTTALFEGELVKIDTAHADSVVACTTSDTVCDGVVIDQLGSGGFCTIGSQFCAIVAGSGSKVKMVLDSGTCSIGQYVTIGTSFTGLVKCSSMQPAAGAYIGRALSAQSSVGQVLDVLTKFQ